MCGIAGCITEREISHSEITKLLQLMRNRGLTLEIIKNLIFEINLYICFILV